MLSPALLYQGTPPSLSPCREPPFGAGPCRLLSPGSPAVPIQPQLSPSCHVDDTSLVRTTSRTGAASCAMPGAGGAGGQPARLLYRVWGSREPQRRQRGGWKQDSNPLRCLTVPPVLAACAEQTYSSLLLPVPNIQKP